MKRKTLGLILGLVVAMSITGCSKPKTVGNTTPDQTVVNGSNKKDKPKDNASGGSTENPKQGQEDNKDKEPKTAVYEHNLIGIKLEYPSNWFISEKSDEILNMLKEYAKDGEFTLKNIAVNDSIQLVDFKAQDDLNTKVAVIVTPFTSVLQGTFDTTEKVGSLADVLDETFVKDFDVEFKTSLGEAIGDYTESTIVPVGSYKCLLTEYSVRTNLGNYSYTQMIVPCGENNLTFVAVSKEGVNPIDKYQVVEDMIKSLVLSEMENKAGGVKNEN